MFVPSKKTFLLPSVLSGREYTWAFKEGHGFVLNAFSVFPIPIGRVKRGW